MTHTKGPWAVIGEADYLDIVYSSGRIAMLESEDDQQSHEETKANAKLIAAAPDLLEALKGCLAMMEAETLDEVHSDLAEVVRDAIAKANGANQ